MSAAGYNVTIQTYTFTYYAFAGIPSWSEARQSPGLLL